MDEEAPRKHRKYPITIYYINSLNKWYWLKIKENYYARIGNKVVKTTVNSPEDLEQYQRLAYKYVSEVSGPVAGDPVDEIVTKIAETLSANKESRKHLKHNVTLYYTKGFEGWVFVECEGRYFSRKGKDFEEVQEASLGDLARYSTHPFDFYFDTKNPIPVEDLRFAAEAEFQELKLNQNPSQNPASFQKKPEKKLDASVKPQNPNSRLLALIKIHADAINARQKKDKTNFLVNDKSLVRESDGAVISIAEDGSMTSAKIKLNPEQASPDETEEQQIERTSKELFDFFAGMAVTYAALYEETGGKFPGEVVNFEIKKSCELLGKDLEKFKKINAKVKAMLTEFVPDNMKQLCTYDGKKLDVKLDAKLNERKSDLAQADLDAAQQRKSVFSV